MSGNISIEALNIKHHFGHGIYAKEVRIKAGNVAVQHRHVYDHLSIIASGQAVFKGDDDLQVVYGPAVINIPAGKHHSFTAITDCVLFCIHTTTETDPANIDEVFVMPADQEKIKGLLES